ncbi:hypothetical protein CYLTODRAFT_439211 [Cylindrobasidium torrendii FP15055 ss-10]|uniref:Hyaluronan-mediated motility receptor C-terminal domain-containing protein n=1 Tax=Cylindrobasidium torrendii FP15055 ss-10 TaxID=1314674 RepID=A0A0D7BUV2_9AGAR|nr:hypothetical protein CYLTODRAFT_439211 [Cylindrobasidium torrendii FP15055 ss-10]
MFPRGPRFEPKKVPDTPGPGTYNIPTESQLDAYKRGAFLEKADRFGTEKIDEGPPPTTASGPSKSAPKSSRAPSTNMAERYAALQKKVEDLERVHKEDKQAYQSEISRLKLDLAHAQKTNNDQATRLDKQKKHDDALNARVNDLTKASNNDKTEIRELRIKLRAAEHDKSQAASKQSDITELKKSLQAAEARRKDDLRERDKRIAELEKTATSERKRKEIAEACCMDLRVGKDNDMDALRNECQDLKDSVRASLSTTEELRAELETCRSAEEAAVQHSESLWIQLKRLTVLYAHLYANTVSNAVHDGVTLANTAMTWHSFRLERKLANSNAQVTELAHILRQMKDRLALADREIRDLHEEIRFLRSADIRPPLPPSFHDLDALVAQVQKELTDSVTLDELAIATTQSCEQQRLICNELLFAYSAAEQELEGTRTENAVLAKDLAQVVQDKDVATLAIEKEREITSKANELLEAARAISEELRGSSEQYKLDAAQLQDTLNSLDAQHQAELRQSAKLMQDLRVAVQQHDIAEEALRVQVDSLTSELAGAEQVYEGYRLLADKVGDLLVKNELAEDVAQQLSKFNAEIMGHKNPLQRIQYVERIRNELAESRYKHATVTRERDELRLERDELSREVDMYKSVAANDRLRGMVTRVKRVPLGSLNAGASLNHGAPQKSTNGRPQEKSSCILDMIPAEGDLTVDDLAG